jgi:hypothetical protein
MVSHSLTSSIGSLMVPHVTYKPHHRAISSHSKQDLVQITTPVSACGTFVTPVLTTSQVHPLAKERVPRALGLF